MAVSRWERGRAEPPADAYVRLGNIADDPLCWFFWGRAGLSTADVMRVLPSAGRRLRQGRVAKVQVVHAGAGTTTSLRPAHFVAIPILPVYAATPEQIRMKLPTSTSLKPKPYGQLPQSGVQILPGQSVFE